MHENQENIRNAEEDALVASMAANAPALMAHALRRMRHREDAEDVVQETMLKAIKGYSGFRGNEISAWLFKILNNTAVDKLTSGHRRELAVAPEDFDSVLDPKALEEVVLDKELIYETIANIQSLSELQRQALLMRLNGMSYEEIAEELETTLLAARLRVHKGRKVLKKRQIK
jgi:RNA polymerase sigma-70 factor, ECF subfamily